jgi:hypothetical protein
MNHYLPDINDQHSLPYFGEDVVIVHKSDALLKVGTMLMIFALVCCVYFYGINHRAEKNLTNRMLIAKPLIDGFHHSRGI